MKNPCPGRGSGGACGCVDVFVVASGLWGGPWEHTVVVVSVASPHSETGERPSVRGGSCVDDDPNPVGGEREARDLATETGSSELRRRGAAWMESIDWTRTESSSLE